MLPKNGPRFGNFRKKVKFILSVFHEDEELTARELADRLTAKGMKVTPQLIGNLIYQRLRPKYITRRKTQDARTYYRVAEGQEHLNTELTEDKSKKEA